MTRTHSANTFDRRRGLRLSGVPRSTGQPNWTIEFNQEVYITSWLGFGSGYRAEAKPEILHHSSQIAISGDPLKCG